MKLKKIALAKKLDISRPTLDRFLNMPGAPQPDQQGRFEYGPTVKFVEKMAASEITLSKTCPAIAELKRQDIFERVRGRRWENDLLENKYVLGTESDARLTGMLRDIQAATYQLENHLPPRLAGLSIGDISKVLKNAVDDMWDDLTRGHEADAKPPTRNAS